MIAKSLISAAILVAIAYSAAESQPVTVPQGPDPYGYYSQYDQNGYYDRQGHYQPLAGTGHLHAAPAPSTEYYEPGKYEMDCRRGNATAGTIFGALGGGLLGGAAGHGRGGAITGGAILGGILGYVISHDIACDDQPYAFRVYAMALNGDLGRRYEWRHGDAYGYFTPTREFQRDGVICRAFSETSYRPDGSSSTRSGIACRQVDGNWRFD
jgi:surface antigen